MALIVGLLCASKNTHLNLLSFPVYQWPSTTIFSLKCPTAPYTKFKHYAMKSLIREIKIQENVQKYIFFEVLVSLLNRFVRVPENISYDKPVEKKKMKK